ncbi:MAG TPA: hypothetical protein VEA40_17935 [Ramlibacter sp.]|nr:hypothetical protein [Ramlibacter sp.]
MKATAIVTAVLLAVGGSAFAQQGESLGQKTDRTLDRAENATQGALKGPNSIGNRTDRVLDRAENATQRAVNPPPGGETLGQKADRVFDRMEDGTKRVWNRATGKTHEPARSAEVRNDTRAMGAGAAAPAARESDHDRRTRMDEAYRNWESRR